MNKIILSLLLAFYVQVKIPAGMSRTYDDVQKLLFVIDGVTIELTLKDGKKAYVPAMFTIIEEK